MPSNDHNHKTDIYESITNAIIAALESSQGVADCSLPWHRLGAPKNLSGRLYRGVNVVALLASAMRHGYTSQTWATYRQWTEQGAQVRKGEKSTLVVFWKFFDSEAESDDAPTEDRSQSSRRCMARAYCVFNTHQVDGYTEPIPVLSEAERLENAERFFTSLSGSVRHGGDRAFYSPKADYIQMPPFALFTSGAGYYSTFAHEYTHWSGAASRLNRNLSGRFGSESYAGEELVAELGAAFLCGTLGISPEPRADHVSYIANWLEILRNNKRAVFTAAALAQKAADYLTEQANREALHAAA
jgi:antirestriction protein ArdC